MCIFECFKKFLFNIKEKDIIDFKITKGYQEKECIICLEKIDFQQKITMIKCGHMYHTSCINKWFEKKKCCPLCDEILLIENN